MKKNILALSITFLFLFTNYSIAQTGLVVQKGMVVSAREEASKIGIEIMKKGGNAFDAMVATELALAVAYPYAGNIGGGGFMVFRKANGEVGSLDYREKAPLAATKDMFLDKDKNVIGKKEYRIAKEGEGDFYEFIRNVMKGVDFYNPKSIVLFDWKTTIRSQYGVRKTLR
mgnify:CR=1 FL=1